MSKSKPEQIRSLEKYYRVTFKQKQDFAAFDGVGYNSFATDNDNNIIALTIIDSGVQDLRPIRELSSLVYLDLTNNQIEDISPLFPNKELKHLFLGG